MIPRAFTFALPLMFAMLAGCQASGGGTVTNEVATETAAEITAEVDVVLAARQVLPEPAEHSATLDDMDLMELEPDAIRSLFGEPDVIRPEARAELWLYRRPECSVHLVYYQDSEVLLYGPDGAFIVGSGSDALRVRYVETTGPEEGTEPDEALCLQSLLERPGPMPGDGSSG